MDAFVILFAQNIYCVCLRVCVWVCVCYVFVCWVVRFCVAWKSKSNFWRNCIWCALRGVSVCVCVSVPALPACVLYTHAKFFGKCDCAEKSTQHTKRSAHEIRMRTMINLNAISRDKNKIIFALNWV